MLIELVLHQRKFVAARARQILTRVVQFVLVQRFLRLGQVNLGLHVVLRARPRLRQRSSQLRHALLVHVQARIGLFHPRHQRRCLSRQRCRIFLRVIQRRVERQIHGPVRQP